MALIQCSDLQINRPCISLMTSSYHLWALALCHELCFIFYIPSYLILSKTLQVDIIISPYFIDEAA